MSKRLQELETSYASLISYRTFPQDRWAKVWRDDVMRGEDFVTVYCFQAGHEFMPADYKVEFDTIEELEKEMREFNKDFRKWQYATGW